MWVNSRYSSSYSVLPVAVCTSGNALSTFVPSYHKSSIVPRNPQWFRLCWSPATFQLSSFSPFPSAIQLITWLALQYLFKRTTCLIHFNLLVLCESVLFILYSPSALLFIHHQYWEIGNSTKQISIYRLRLSFSAIPLRRSAVVHVLTRQIVTSRPCDLPELDGDFLPALVLYWRPSSCKDGVRNFTIIQTKISVGRIDDCIHLKKHK